MAHHYSHRHRWHSFHHHHHHHHSTQPPEEHEEHSASEGSSVRHHIHEHCNNNSQADSHYHHCHPHQRQDKSHTARKKCHAKASVTSSNSSGSSVNSSCLASSSSSSSDSSSSDSSSSSNSSSSSSSKSYFSHSSFSSPSSGSCWSSKASLENVPFASHSRKSIQRPQHSQSCMDIPRGRKAFEDDEDEVDRMPLLESDGHFQRSTSIEKNFAAKEKSGGTARKAKYSQQQNEKSFLMQQENYAEGLAIAANIRKTKSMEVLSRQTDNSGVGDFDEQEQEKRKQEAHKNFVKEKIKFSAFLNEITRQVLSPSRLTSLGVTDVHRPSCPLQTLVKSPKSENKPDRKLKSSRSQRKSSVSSVTSTAHSHISKQSHSSKHSHVDKHSHSRLHIHSSKTSHSNKNFHSEKGFVNQQQHHQAAPKHCHNSTRSDTRNCSSSRSNSSEKENSRKSQNKQHIHSSTPHPCSSELKNVHHHVYPESHHLHTHNESHHHHSPSSHHHHETHHNLSPHHHSSRSDPHQYSSPSSHHHYVHHSPSPSHRSYISGMHHHCSHAESHQYPCHSESDNLHSSSPSHHHHRRDHHTLSPHHHLTHSETSHHHSYPESHQTPQSHIKPHHNHSDCESSHSTSNQHYQFHHEISHQYHSNPESSHSHSSYPDNHQHTSLSEKEHHQHSTSNSKEHCHHHHSHSESYHSSDPQTHHNNHSDHLESYHHHHSHFEKQHKDHEPLEFQNFNSEFHDNRVESDHHYLHKPQDFHHHSHSDSHHHPNSESNHPYHHEHSECHHHSQPEFHHHNSKSVPQDHHSVNPESHSQYSHSVLHHHSNSEIIPYHSHFKDDNYNEDHPSPLRHSPVGQRSISPHSNDSSTSSTAHDNQSTVSYQGTSPFPKEKDSELERLMMLQEQNEVLHHNLLQTTMQIECMGAEFKNGHQLLESELQKTRIELTSLMDQFTRLRENYSCTQQTNHLLEKQLHCVAQNMGGESKRLNQRISELTEQLSAAKTTIQSLETINVTSMLQDALVKHFKSDDPITLPLPAAPPPAQFMDSDHYDKISMTGDAQSLGTLPEEEESDWSEMGDEAQNCVLRGSPGIHENTSYLQWQQRQDFWEGAHQYEGNSDTESESGGEENKVHKLSHPLQIPHLKFTVHPETLPVPIADVSLACFKQSKNVPTSKGNKVTDVRNLGSSIRVLSASLEEIHSTGLLKQQQNQEDHHGQLRSNKSLMDLHHSQIRPSQVSYRNKIVCNWTETHSQSSENVNSMVGLESDKKMLDHFIHDGESTHL